MPFNGFGESLFIVIDVVLGLYKSFTKGSLFFIQAVVAIAAICTHCALPGSWVHVNGRLLDVLVRLRDPQYPPGGGDIRTS